MQEFILRFIPSALQGNLDVFRRARLLVTTCFFSSLIALFYSLQYFVLMGNMFGGTTLFLAFILLVSLPLQLRNGANMNVLANILVASFLFVSTVLVSLEGGHDTVTRIWIAIVPLLAVMFTGLKGGLRWLMATLVILTVFYALKIMGIEVPVIEIPPSQKQLQSYLGMVGIAVLVFVLAQIYERSKDATLAQMETLRKESEARAAADYSSLEAMKEENENRAKRDLEQIEGQKQYLASHVSTALHAIELMSEGDLTGRLQAEADDDIGMLFNAINRSIENVSAMIAQVAASVNNTADAVTHISSATEELSSGAKEQNGQVVQLAGAVEEMSRTISENTHQISVAAYEASLANDEAFQSEQVMRSMISNVEKVGRVVLDSAAKIKQLGQSSEKIGEIVSVIDEIADQTNLLALNAAIEAARAGESGRGFAVVADEVRKLAERTQKATKEISGMIKTIQNEMGAAVKGMNEGTTLVEQGSQLVAQTTQALEQIINRTSKVSDVMSQVASASDQQSSTSSQMAQSMHAMSAVVEQSTQGVNDIAQSIAHLSRQADELRDSMSRFVLQRELLNVGKSSTKALPAAANKRSWTR
ncbi:MAG: methyl-accepting chemotaxis protein [Candidatus Kapabacteria bacterium]|jgi:methyl-accepting chemotaxis protein|nr:methyl-accepting chemotaxis protein [Candidatus Kapabacteria bacterium]